MAIITLDGVGSLGIIKDRADHELPPEALSDGQNIRFTDGALHKFHGHEVYAGALSGVPLWIRPHYNEDSFYWIYGTATSVFATDGTTHKSITRTTGGAYSASLDSNWNGGSLNGILIVNNGIDEPQQWDNDFATPGRLTALSNWKSAGESTLSARLIVPFNNYLLALDVVEDGTRYEDVLRWSAPALPGAVPPSWDYNSPSAGAGRRPLSGTSGAILAAAKISSGMMLYKENGTYLLSFVGGNLIFRTDLIFGSLGVLSYDCVTDFDEGNRHVLLSSDFDIVVHSGREILNTANNRIRRWLQNNIDSTYYNRSFVVYYPAQKEVWVCFPQLGADVPDLAVVWSIQSNSFGVRELPSASFAAVGVAEAASPDTWDGAGSETWDGADRAWNARLFGVRSRKLLLAGHSALRMYAVDGTDQFAGANMVAAAERTGLGLIGRDRQGNWKVDFERRKYLRAIWPKLEGGPVDIYALAQDVRGGPVRVQGPVSFDPRTQRKVNFHISGALLGYRIESRTNTSWKLYGLDLDISDAGVY